MFYCRSIYSIITPTIAAMIRLVVLLALGRLITAILTIFVTLGNNGNGAFASAVPNPDVVTIIHEMQKEIKVLRKRDDAAKLKMETMNNEIGIMKAKLLTSGLTLFSNSSKIS